MFAVEDINLPHITLFKTTLKSAFPLSQRGCPVQNIDYVRELHILSKILISFLYMSLCTICEELDLGPGDRSVDGQRLGEYNKLLNRADHGCEACRFFSTILQSSIDWEGRVSELSRRIVFLTSLRLDVRKPENIGVRRYSCDDLVIDLCTSENHTG
jgi:hypothetical protein